MIPLTPVQQEAYENATVCYLCKEGSFIPKDKKLRKVRDRCHLTGQYRGPAHGLSNLRYKTPDFFPVVLHNLSGYDAHLFIKNPGVTDGNINCIPNNEEKYISFTKQIKVGSYEKDGKTGLLEGVLAYFTHLKKMTSLIRFFQLIMQEYDSKCLKMCLIILKVFKIC
jgi:hypothetical protein